MAGSVRRISDGNRIYNARRTEFVPGTDRSARTEFVPGTDRSPLYDGHLVRRRWGRPASSRNVRGVSLAGGGGFESSPTSSRRTRCPAYKRLIDVRTGAWLSSGRIEIALPFIVRRTSCPSTLGLAGFEPERALGVARRWRRAARQFVPGTFRFSCQALVAFFRLSIPKTPFSLNLACHADPAFFLIHSLVIGARHFPLFQALPSLPSLISGQV